MVCLLGSILFSSAITCYFKLDKHNIAKEPLNYIGKYRNKVNIGVIVAIAVFGLLYIWFSIGFALWVIIILSLYIGWGLVFLLILIFFFLYFFKYLQNR